MKKLGAAIYKEMLLVLNDRVGLLLMYLMPLILVFLITTIQNSAFDLVKENKLKAVIANRDEGTLGDSLIHYMRLSGGFDIKLVSVSDAQLKKTVLREKALVGLYIPSDYSTSMQTNASAVSSALLRDMGMAEETQKHRTKPGELSLYFDPVVQQNYRHTIQNGLQQLNAAIENKMMLGQLFTDLGYDSVPAEVAEAMQNNQTRWKVENAQNGEGQELLPNATQHNVPAWTIFAMFFMVISLGGNLVKERLSGSFLRLQTIPGAFKNVLIGKYVIYLFVAITQILLLFSLGMTVFPAIGLPKLSFPHAFFPLLVVILLASSAAISYAMLIGTFAKTQEQANGFGAVSIVIFAAIGGIWVPYFVMPDYMQTIGLISPLKWCLDGFYALFLQNGNWTELFPSITFLLLFTGMCQFLIFWKLRSQNYI